MKSSYGLFRPLGLILLMAASPGFLFGQDPGFTVRGSVVDTLSGKPVPGALLRLQAGLDVKTGPDGSFELTDLPDGTYQVAIVTPGCRVTLGSFDASAASRQPLVLQVAAPLPSGLALPPDPHPGSRIVSAVDIEEMSVGTLAELLQRVAPEMIRSASVQPGSQPRVASRAVASAQGSISPILVLDGVNLGSLSSPGILDMIHPADIAFLELFRGAMGGWSYGTGASGGVLRITGKRGGFQQPPDLDLTRCALPRWR
ncbi:carboxypeptidase regulatory-like domain-containing protein [Gemmatimonadota bacterium]